MWSEEELERLREVFAEMQGSMDRAELAKSIANHFPHRAIADVTNQLKEAGLITLPQNRGRGSVSEEAGEKSECPLL